MTSWPRKRSWAGGGTAVGGPVTYPGLGRLPSAESTVATGLTVIPNPCRCSVVVHFIRLGTVVGVPRELYLAWRTSLGAVVDLPAHLGTVVVTASPYIVVVTLGAVVDLPAHAGSVVVTASPYIILVTLGAVVDLPAHLGTVVETASPSIASGTTPLHDTLIL